MAGSAIIGSLRVVLGIDTAVFDKGLADAMKSLKGIGKSMQSVGKNMSGYLTAPIVGFGALTVKTAGDFEAALNRVEAATGATAGEFKAMRDMAVQLGADTIFSASESADAMEMLAKNGLTASQILDGAVSASMALAASSGSELAAAADVATDVMMNFGKEANELGGLVDGITGVLLESKFGFDDYRLALGQAGGVAGNLGVEFEDFNAVIAVTSSAFASGSDAGTSFKAFLTRLVPVSKTAAAAMQELGLEFFNADGSIKNMTEVADELHKKMGNLSDQDLNRHMKDIFGVDAMRTAIMLMKQGGDGVEEMRARINNASAEEQAAARLKGFNGELEKLSGAFESLQIAIADSGLLAMVTSFVSKLAEWVDVLAETNPEILKWGTIIAGLTAIIGPVLIALGALAAAIAAIGLPVTATVAAIASISAALVAFWPQIQQVDQALMQWARNFDQAVVSLFNQGVQKIKQLGQEIVASFRALASEMYQIGVDLMRGLWNGIKSMFGTVKDGIANIGAGIRDRFKSILGIHSPSTVFHGLGVNIIQGLNNGMQSMSGAVAGGATSIVDGISGAFDSLGSSIAEAIKGTKSWRDVALEAINSIARSLLSTMNFGGGFFGSVFKGLLGGLVGFQHGGSFTVGGSGGTDSQLVAFRASPGEMVDVRKGNQARHGDVQEIVVRGVFVDDGGVVKGIAMQESAAATGNLAKRVPAMVEQRTNTRQTRRTRP